MAKFQHAADTSTVVAQQTIRLHIAAGCIQDRRLLEVGQDERAEEIPRWQEVAKGLAPGTLPQAYRTNEDELLFQTNWLERAGTDNEQGINLAGLNLARGLAVHAIVYDGHSLTLGRFWNGDIGKHDD